MGPIPLRRPNPIVSSAYAPHGTLGTAIEQTAGIGIRADSNDSGGSGGSSNLASPALVVALTVIGLLSLTMFSMFGRRLLEAGQQRQGQGTVTGSETTGAAGDHYVLLAEMLGLHVNHRPRTATQRPLAVLSDKPKMWDVQIHARLPGAETHNKLQWRWDDIMPIAVVVSEREDRQARTPAPPAPTSVPRRSTDRRTCRLLRWLGRRRRRRAPVGEVGEAGQEGQRSTRNERLRVPHPHKDIQVVVAIAMPCRPRRVSSHLEMRPSLDYSIGVQTIPWNDGV